MIMVTHVPRTNQKLVLREKKIDKVGGGRGGGGERERGGGKEREGEKERERLNRCQ